MWGSDDFGAREAGASLGHLAMALRLGAEAMDFQKVMLAFRQRNGGRALILKAIEVIKRD